MPERYRFRNAMPTPGLRASILAPEVLDGIAKLRLYDPIDSWGGDWGVSAKEFATAPGYDKIAINPPYSEGRAKEHTLAALTHLNEKGIMVAVLPAGYKPEEWIGNEFVCAKSGRDFANEFEDTGITVAVFVFKRA